ncbi:MAG: DNA repair protein RadC [Lentisphaerae bacterium]|jgi:DNA repair protein RadC|nr:DNA repair protein RadC [Lentisphaerota bacterium]
MEKHLYQSESKSGETLREATKIVPSRAARSKKLDQEMAKKDMPRERLRAGGHLADHELLAIIIGKGVKGSNVIDVAKAIIKDFETLSNLTKASIEELKKYDGIGEVKAIEILAVLEIAKRVRENQRDSDARSLLTHPEVVAAKVQDYKMSEDTESFFVLPIDKKCRLCGPMTEVTRGILDSSLVHPREVFRVALRWSAASIIVAHNHPSGDPTPSREDLEVTRKLVEAGRIISIPLTDHVIVGDEQLFPPGFYSVRRNGVVAFD